MYRRVWLGCRIWFWRSGFAGGVLVSDFDRGGWTRETHNLVPKEFESLYRPHGLSRCLDISKCYMCLAAHLLGLHSNDIEDRSIGREEGIEGETEVIFLYLG